MIRHIVFFSAKDGVDVETVRAGLMILAQIPDAAHLEVGVNAKVDALGNEVDLVVYAEFEDQAALDRFKKHPLYAESIRRVRPLRDLRIAADCTAMR